MATFEKFNVYRGEAMTRYFRVYPLPGEKKGGVKRAPGRPRVYNGSIRRQVGAALKAHGLTKGLAYLAKEKGLKVSMTLARAVAKEVGLVFPKGRPAKAA